ncbi:MAG: pitrilysin family protein [Lentimicrobiaceae bacterium]|nr:pitrilysin family protein [Lentimicrobiaceae bacterium]
MSKDFQTNTGNTGILPVTEIVVPRVDYEQFLLPNGLNIVLHADHSNPIVAIAILFHVGSSREKPGKTGFAHFFEHMLFQRSENIPRGEFFTKINDLGGVFNGGTWQDGTVYYEVVPSDALEKILWMESDRMGYLINTVTQSALEREKDIVINEKRQRVDNQPYGHTSFVIDQALYPSGHPYSWQVIGTIEDVRSASIDDVREFYEKYYAVNNATIVIAGDFESTEVKKLIDKYFGEFKSRPVPELPRPEPVLLSKTRRLFHEDNFALVPELNIVFPTVPMYHKDSYALQILSDLLADGKRAPLYKEIVEKHKLAPELSVNNQPMELSGKFVITVRAFEGVNLNKVHEAVFNAFRQFEINGFSDSDLQRIKNLNETTFYHGISSLLDKSFQLVQGSVFGNDPARFAEDMRLLHAVSRDDIMDVFNKYIKSANYIVSSFVPRGQTDLILKDSEMAYVIEENIDESTSENVDINTEDEPFEYTPSLINRRIEPELGKKPLLTLPEIFNTQLNNGLKVLGITNTSLPLVFFSLRFKGGHLFDTLKSPGVSRLVAEMMLEGTQTRTPEELEEAIGQLGANIQVNASHEYLSLAGSCLARNYIKVIELVQEIILQPRWDEMEFERIKQATINTILQRKANPNSVAINVFFRRIYGDDHILGRPITGTETSVSEIHLDDLKNYYSQYLTPGMATFHFAGDLEPEKALKSLGFLEEHWQGGETPVPEFKLPQPAKKPKLCFVDVSDAKQSIILVGSPAMQRNHPDYAGANIVNYKLGEGSGGKLFTVLRLEKGYTYGAYSYFMPRNTQGLFMGNANVQSAFTLESLKLFKQILSAYGDEYSQADLEITRTALIRANAGKFEHLQSKLEMLHEISTFNLPFDYIKQEEATAEQITLEEAKTIFSKYIRPDQMIYVVSGDARTQLATLHEAGLGEPVLVDVYGNLIH